MSLVRSRERAQANEAAEIFSQLEGEIREVVSQGSTAPRPRQGNDNELAASNIGSILQHVSGASVQEIEKLIAELQILREALQREAARVQREIEGYAALIQNTRHSITTISNSLSFWQSDRGDTPRISA
jgi:chromosome segregation ATPase